MSEVIIKDGEPAAVVEKSEVDAAVEIAEKIVDKAEQIARTDTDLSGALSAIGQRLEALQVSNGEAHARIMSALDALGGLINNIGTVLASMMAALADDVEDAIEGAPDGEGGGGEEEVPDATKDKAPAGDEPEPRAKKKRKLV